MAEEYTLNDRLEEFLEERSKFPIRTGNVAGVMLLVRELAMGVDKRLWSTDLKIYNNGSTGDENLREYFQLRWNEEFLNQLLEPLLGRGYIKRNRHQYILSELAFQLIEEESYNIFVSYKRSESSALALLVVCRLKAHELVPFCDVALDVGGNWHADLEEKIQQNDFFVILLGKDTLSSSMTVKEIEWALKFERTIIPVWHSGFDISDDRWKNVPAEVMNSIQRTNAIRVTEESASGYNTAIVELLNRFGVTP